MPAKQLRIVSTLLLSFAVAQAGLGSGYLDDHARALIIAHATNAFAVVAMSLVAVLLGFGYWRAGGPRWTFVLPLCLLAASGVQMALGFAGVLGGHVLLGALYLSAVTAYCSYCWRHQPAARSVPVH